MTEPVRVFTEPKFERTLAGFSFIWDDVLIELERVNDNAEGEISVYHLLPDGREILKYTRISLLNGQNLETFIKNLENNNGVNIDWHRTMTHVAYRTVQALRDGLKLENINEPPKSMATDYALYPFLPLNEPTTLYGKGGLGKGILADLFAFTYATGFSIPNLPYIHVNKPGVVLYLDWERTSELHRQRITAIKQGLKLESDLPIHYLRCDHPINLIIDQIVKRVSSIGATLTIADSQMAATAGMGTRITDAEASADYYNCLRRIGGTSLTIDHTTKAGANASEDDGPINSVVKTNRASSIYRIDSDQEEDSDVAQLQIKHTKFNLGRKQGKRGIEIEYHNEKNDQGQDVLISIDFHQFDLENNERFRANLKDWQIIMAVMKDQRGRPLECAEIAKIATDQYPDRKIDPKRAYDVMNQKKKVFAKVNMGGESKWGLLER